MNVIRIPTGPLGTNTYIVHSDNADIDGRIPCVVIDPAASMPVLKTLEEKGLKCTHILLTHGHFDHIMGVKKLRDAEDAKVFIHAADAAALSGGEGSLAFMAGAYVQPCEVDRRLSDGDEFTAAGIDFRVIATPGHTPGGVCYLIESEKTVFTGDTLFRLSVGRTDLAGGDGEQLYESILYRLFSLQGDYRLLPGHEGESTLDYERKHNPYMKNGGIY